MKKVRIKYPFLRIPVGTEIMVPAEVAEGLINTGAADLAEPDKAVLEPSETREDKKPRKYQRRAASD